MLCNFLLRGNLRCLFFKGKWDDLEIVGLGEESPMTFNGHWIRGCSRIHCTQPGFQKTVLRFLLLCGIPLLVDGVRVYLMSKDILEIYESITFLI